MSVLNKKKTKNITHLNNYSINKTLENIRQYKRKKVVRIRIGTILAVGCVLIGMTGLPLLENIQKTEEYQLLHAEAKTNLENLELEKDQLEYQVTLLEDEEYIAKLARKELNLSKSNEVLINLPEKNEVEDEADEVSINEEENESE